MPISTDIHHWPAFSGSSSGSAEVGAITGLIVVDNSFLYNTCLRLLVNNVDFADLVRNCRPHVSFAHILVPTKTSISPGMEAPVHIAYKSLGGYKSGH
jgi:hypothetical protein